MVQCHDPECFLFKGIPQLEYQEDNLSKGVPKNHMLEDFDKILKIIQRTFTCEGIFNMIYQYHIRLLLHFTGKDVINLPF
jgi:hypothetical protein